MSFNNVARFNRALGFNSAPYAVTSPIYLNLTALDAKSIRISQSVQDVYPECQITIDGYYNLTLSSIQYAYCSVTDHTGTSQTIFTGLVPKTGVDFNAAANETTILGYGAGWYLTKQYVPDHLLHSTAGTNPSITIRELLAGDEWAMLTGIEPYKILPVTDWGTDLNAKAWDFSRVTTKGQAISRICDYCRFIFFVGSHGTQPAGYFCHEDDLDTYGDIPAKVTFTSPDPYVLSVNLTSQGDEMANSVAILGRTSTGASITATSKSADVIQGNVIPIEIVESSGAYATQAQVSARATELYDFYVDPVDVYTARFDLRMDLRLYQLIAFSGYTGISTEDMRISKITYIIEPAKKEVEVEFVPADHFSSIGKMYRCFNPDLSEEIQNIFGSLALQMPTNEIGTITDIDEDNDRSTVLLEDGRSVDSRII